MATIPPPVGSDGKINFPNMLGSKRRRMRSGGNVSTVTNNVPKPVTTSADDGDEKVAETSRCKGATTIPIFLKKTYKMIETCDPNIASWTPDGEMFVVKDPDLFATNVIPQYFDHNKFTSFARQLNFYGFRKMQAKPIRNADFDVDTAKHVTFYNEKFKRGRCDLLKEIQRSTRGGNAPGGGGEKEVQALRDQVHALENQVDEMNITLEDRMRRLELDMLSRMEQMMMAMHQHQQQTTLMHQQSIGTITSAVTQGQKNILLNQQMQADDVENNVAWDPLPMDNNKGNIRMSSMGPMAIVSQDSRRSATEMHAPPTLPPHPKQKQLPINALPLPLNLPPSRLNSLISRGLSRGVSGLSVDSSASAVLLRNSWEDKFFSMLMLGENEANAQQQVQQQQQAQQMMGQMANVSNGGPISDADLRHNQQMVNSLQIRGDNDDYRTLLDAQHTHEL